MAIFIREVIGELMKVRWPSRAGLLRSTSQMAILVVATILLVGVLGWAFTSLVANAFG
jgi:preprotein translocase SecE subunit